jgi:hypothetical protein
LVDSNIKIFEVKMSSGSVVNLSMLAENYPTNYHSNEFWEWIGRSVATFGFLEEVLAKAIFALTATVEYKENEIADALAAWLPKLEKTLYETLGYLINEYEKAAKSNQKFACQNFEELIEHLRKASELRNVICHGSWRPPDTSGSSIPLFVNRKMMVFESRVDVQYLKGLQRHVAELALNVVNTVTVIGVQFPGSNGPGKPV